MNDQQPVLTARRIVDEFDYRPELARSVVLVFDPSLVGDEPRRRFRPAPSPKPFRKISQPHADVSVVAANGVGSPGAAVAVDFLAAFGVQHVVVVGVAGDLRGDRSRGTQAFAVAGAHSDEGTSRHYLNDDAGGSKLDAAPALVAALTTQTSRGPLTVATTDVPLRHTPTRLRMLRAHADLVDMECAAVFAAASAFGLSAAALLVVSDHFTDDGWCAAQGDVTNATRAAVADAVDVLASFGAPHGSTQGRST